MTANSARHCLLELLTLRWIAFAFEWNIVILVLGDQGQMKEWFSIQTLHQSNL